MKVIRPSVEYIHQGEGLAGIYQHIDKCARTCYKSENKFDPDKSEAFVQGLIERGHLAMLEHGTIYLYIKANIDREACLFYEQNPYSKVVKKDFGEGEDYYVTTNMRVLVENDRTGDVRYICHPTGHHAKRHTLKFITDIGVCREILRHRRMSFANESTRYCNYHSDKFNNQITFIIPSWCGHLPDDVKFQDFKEKKQEELNQLMWLAFMGKIEEHYLYLVKNGWSAQQARAVLPLCTKSELVVTGFEEDWMHFFDLRLYGKTGKPHPDMEYVAKLAFDEFVNKGIIQVNELKL